MTNVQKSLFKSISYRVISIIVTFIVSYVVTGSLTIAGAIVSVDAAVKVVVYYGHERLWHKIYGKFKEQNEQSN